MNVIALGGVNLDILGQSDGPFAFGDSNPGRIRFRAGGVSHNIAAELVRLGHHVSLVSCLGSGHASMTVRAMCLSEGIDTDLCISGNTGPGVYLCLHGPDGDMIAAVNDMRGMESLRPETVLPLLEERDMDLMVMDCNLPEDTLIAAARVWGNRVPIFIDPVSAFKAGRCLKALPFISAVKPNLTEAREMTGRESAGDCASAILGMGAKTVFISMGAAGVYYASDKERGVCPAIPLPEGTPLTGAGDALCAGLISGISKGLSAAGCAREGVRCADLRLRRADAFL
ncbi:MAG: carbohydrate kinase family protein [Clostridia bacterium]|nr:carbohydrate kinase family protein [Clostridia bacterium]